MRRPVCMAGLAFVMILWIIVSQLPHRADTFDELDKEKVTVAGIVEWKEYRRSGGEKTLTVSLGHVMVLKPEQSMTASQFLSESDRQSNKAINADTDSIYKTLEKSERQLQREDKELRRKYVRSGAEQIKGLICYLEEDVQGTADEENLRMGSRVILEGKLRTMQHASNPGEFDSADYYQIMGQQGRLMNSRIVWQGEHYDAFRESLCRLRQYFSMLLEVCYPEKEAEVMKAMLLGEKGMLDQELKGLYQQNGIIHILSISGLHLSLLGMGFHKLLEKLRFPGKLNLLLSVAFMFCYGTMTGMGVSVIRALIMFFFRMAAVFFHRTYDMLTALVVAAVTLLIQQPLYLEHSGFLFSFGAVCGIGTLLPAAMENLLWEKKALRSLVSGAVVSVGTLPIYLSYYYEFPPYSIFLNLLVIPCMSLVLGCGLLTLGAGCLWLPLGQLPALAGRVLLLFYEKSCELCSRLPGHRMITGCPESWQILLFLLLLVFLVWRNRKLPKLLFWQILLLALLLLTGRFLGGFEVHMLDVGQGDCICIETEQGESMLIDGGSTDKKEVDVYQIVPFLKYQGISELKAVAVTHPDSDHMNGIQGMLEKYQENGIYIGTLLLPSVRENGKNENYRRLEELAAENEIPIHYLSAGESFELGEAELVCLHPEEQSCYSDANEMSVVLYLQRKEFTALFTGDLEGEGERQLLERMSAADITLLKVAHHGSAGATTAEFLERVRPLTAIISSGHGNSYGHPHEETLERLRKSGAQIFGTQENGEITIRYRGGKLLLQTFMAEK